MLADFECFSYLDVVGETAFMFSLHFVDDFEIVFVELMMTVLIMLSDAGMAPLFVINGSPMFFPSLLEGPCRLANVYGLVRTFTCVFINAFGFCRVRFCFIVGAEDIF